MNRLEGRTAVVIGAGSMKSGQMSNGRAASLLFAREGAKVVAVDVSAPAAEETAAAIRAEGFECLPIIADASDEAAVAEVFEQTLARYGQVDILHNNVGVLTFGSVLNTDAATWDRMMAVNVKSMFLTTRAALPHMISQGRGSIINVSALAAVRYLGPAITYTASKAAVNGFTQAVAIEYAKAGVRCNAILPGFIDTPVGFSAYERGDPAEVPARIALRNARLAGGKPGSPWDIARAALFLASDESSYLNGVLMPVDGGVMNLSPTAV
jgi:hypothetical protein